MPKKTRKQKIRADRLRTRGDEEERVISGAAFSHQTDGQLSQRATYTYVGTAFSPSPSFVQHSREEYRSIRRDVGKIGFFTLIALLFQGVLYFLLHAR